jgi:hypothetical protein
VTPPLRLDTTRIYRDAYERAGTESGLLDERNAQGEAEEEFSGDDTAEVF